MRQYQINCLHKARALGEETIPDLHTIEQPSGSNQQDTTSSDDEMEYKTIWFGWGTYFSGSVLVLTQKILKKIVPLPTPQARAGAGKAPITKTAKSKARKSANGDTNPIIPISSKLVHANPKKHQAAGVTRPSAGPGRMSSAPKNQPNHPIRNLETSSKLIAMTSAHKSPIQTSATCISNT